MRSKQVNFFIMPEDLIKIGEYLSGLNVKVIYQPIRDKDQIYSDKIGFSKWTLYLTREEFKEKVKIDYIAKQGYYLVDDTVSYALQFSTGGFLYHSNILERGRLYYKKSYYNDEGYITVKEKEFTDWADMIIKNVKKHFLVKYGEHKVCYFTKATLEWMNQTNAKPELGGLGLISDLPDK